MNKVALINQSFESDNQVSFRNELHDLCSRHSELDLLSSVAGIIDWW